MTQRIKIQDGVVVYQNADSTVDLDFYINGNLHVSNTIYGALSGNAATASKWLTARTISTTGDATWSVLVDGSANVTNPITLATVNASPQTLTFTKTTINGKGLVTATTPVTNSDITTSLGYVPVNKAGDTMTGYLVLNADPIANLQAATKHYVDNVASGLTVHAACVTSTNGVNLAAVYNNGAGGVGATLTGGGAIPTIGGIVPVVGNRVLVKDQSNNIQNGIYVVTQATANWVMTRADDFDGSPTTEIQAGDSVFVQQGSLGGTQWVQTTSNVVVGTSSIIFTQFGGPGTYVGGPGISVAANTISNTGVLSNIAGSNIAVSGATGNVTISLTGTVPSSATSVITNDIVTATSVYPTWVSATSGNQAAHTSSPNLSFVPSTGYLSVQGLRLPAITKVSYLIGLTNTQAVAGQRILVTFPSTAAGFVGTLSVYTDRPTNDNTSGNYLVAKYDIIRGGGATGAFASFIVSNCVSDSIAIPSPIWYFDTTSGQAYCRIGQAANSFTYTIVTELSDTTPSSVLVDAGTAPTGVVVVPTISQVTTNNLDYTLAVAGDSIVRTGLSERFRILGTGGAWSLGATGTNLGTNGQALISTGSTTSPTWSSTITGSASLNVLKAGDTMTGDLSITKALPALTIGTTGPDDSANLYFSNQSLFRWRTGKSNASETGSNAGSNYFIMSYADDGLTATTRLTISRANGLLTVPGGIAATVTGNAATASALQTPRTITATGDANWSVSFDGSTNVTAGLTLGNVNGNVGTFGSANTIPTITVNSKGLVTAVSTSPLSYIFTSGVPSPGPLTYPSNSINCFDAISSTDFPGNYWTGVQSNGPGGVRSMQLAANWNSEELAPSGLIFRTNDDTGTQSAWSPWTTIWNSQNLINVSQLSNDAGYITSGALAPYLPLAGGTMSGTINTTAGETFRIVNSGGYISGWNAANTLRTGYLQFNSGSNIILAAEASNALSLQTAGGSMVIATGGQTTFSAQVNAPAFNATSTKNVKKKIKDLDRAYLLKFAKLRPREYDRRDYKAHEFGFIAEEMDEIYPEVVGKDYLGNPTGIDYGKLSTILTAKVQEQQLLIEELQTQMKEILELVKGSK